jgi:putative tributyrin esterase
MGGTRTTVGSYRDVALSSAQPDNAQLRVLTFESPALGGRGEVTLFVPPEEPSDMPLAILLNGVYGSHWAWAAQGGADRTAGRLMAEARIRPMALAMPADGLWSDATGFVRHAHGDYERWIMEDVVGCVREIVPQVGPALLLAGLSIGGYGALRLGAKYGGRVRGVSAHSPITRLHDMARFAEEPNSYLAEEPFVGVWIARHRATLPPIRFDCGSEDPLIDASRRLHEELTHQRVPHVYEEFPGGHDWSYWSAHLQDTLLFFEECLTGAAAL